MKLGEIIRRWRLMAERDLRSVGAEIGISAATLMRLEQGHVPDGKTLAKVLAWMLTEQSEKKSEVVREGKQDAVRRQ